MPETSPSATPDPLAQTSPLSSTPTSSTNEQDPHARYVSQDFLVYESLVRYVVGDAPLRDASNERIRSLKAAGADLAYLGYWRHRYELAFHFFASKPPVQSRPGLGPASYQPSGTPDRTACSHADEDARNHFGHDPEYNARQAAAVEQLRKQFEQQIHQESLKLAIERQNWLEEARRQSEQDRYRLAWFQAHNVVRPDDQLGVIKITDL